MHESVEASLEEYLRGGTNMPELETHLRQCDECRTEVEAMRAQSLLFRSLRAPEDAEPSAGFYARVMTRIEAQARPSVWSLFGESIFARRLIYASATFLVLLGSYLVSETRSGESFSPDSPELILAGEQMPAPVTMEDPQRDREVILVDLATYGGDGDEQEYQ